MEIDEKKKPGYLSFVQPLLLIFILLTYSIGVGLVHHQGGNLNWMNIFLGGALCLLLIPIRNYLSAYYDHPTNPTCRLHPDDPRMDHLKRLEKLTLLRVALLLLTAFAVVVVLLLIRHSFNLTAAIIVGTAFLLSFFSACPPFQLEKHGYGEIAEAILVCNLAPALGYLMNFSDLHILLVMLTLPLTLVYIAQKIVLGLETYAFDRNHRIQSMVIRLDWLKAMQAHNYLILSAFLFVGVFALVGQPWVLTWPILLTIPLGVFQIIQILGIISGAPPRWKILKLTATSTFVIMAYLISFTLWTK